MFLTNVERVRCVLSDHLMKLNVQLFYQNSYVLRLQLWLSWPAIVHAFLGVFVNVLPNEPCALLVSI